MKHLCFVLVGFGLAISGYLLWRHFVLADLSAQTGTDYCSALFRTGCDDALRSPLAVQLGLPLAGWGLVYYGTLISLLLLGRILGEAFQFEATTAALLLALAAAFGSVALFAAMMSDLSPFCPLCATVHAINLLLLIPLKHLTGRPVKQSSHAVAAAIKYIVSGKTADPIGARWKSVGFVTAALVAVVIYQWVFVEFTTCSQVAEALFDPQQIVAQFEESVQHEIPIDDMAPTLGPLEAPVQMVVFSDFRCPGCRKLAQIMPPLAKQFENALRIVFKHYPLDIACNAAVKQEFHPGACRAAQAAEAAREQGQFWAFHDSVFRAPSGDKTTLRSIAEELDLDINRFEGRRTQTTIQSRIQADIELGTRLGVDGTPSVFINGRRVYDIRPKTLLLLVAYEVKVAKSGTPQNRVTSPLVKH